MKIFLKQVLLRLINSYKNKSITFLALFKKLRRLIGKFVIYLILYIFIKYILNAYSINLLDPFYILIFCIVGLIISFIFALDYLFKYIIYSYFKKDVNVTIPTKLPKLVYNYLNHLKILSNIDISLQKLFLLDLAIYVFIIFLLIFLLIIIK